MGKKITLKITDKFTLFVKLSRRIPNEVNINDSVRDMFPEVSNVRKPRQKSSRWLLVDFETSEQAEEFKKILIEKKEIAKIRVKVNKLNIKKIDRTSSPDNERQQYVNSLTKQAFQARSLEKYSNKLLITNLPESITSSEIADLFPHHISIDLKRSPKVRAIISYSSVKEAIAARMQVRPQWEGQKIRVILLLLGNETRKSESQGTASKHKQSQAKEGNKFVKPLRYFENAEIK